MTLGRLFRRAPRRPDRWDDEPDDAAVVASIRDYAQASGPADEDIVARSRESLRSAFLSARAAHPADKAAVAPRPSRRLAPRRLALGAVVVALLAVAGIGGTLAESGPGEPFYRLRLDVEALTLPAPGTPERLDADLARAQARLDEAREAASNGNWQAAAAAADAYSDVVAAVADEPGVGAETVKARLMTQLQALESVRATSSGPADTALGRAIEEVRVCLEAPGTSPQPTPRATDAGPNGGPGSTGRASPEPASGKSPGPNGSAGPQTSVEPRSSAVPNASASPVVPGGDGGNGGAGGTASPAPAGSNGPGDNGPGPSASPATTDHGGGQGPGGPVNGP